MVAVPNSRLFLAGFVFFLYSFAASNFRRQIQEARGQGTTKCGHDAPPTHNPPSLRAVAQRPHGPIPADAEADLEDCLRHDPGGTGEPLGSREC